MTKLEEKKRRLREIAREQGGFFTAGQAEALGFQNPHQGRFVADGRWERKRRGIFRLEGEASTDFDDLHILSLFFRRRDGSSGGTFGLETAAAIHNIGDFNPSRIILLVDRPLRKRAKIPDNVELLLADDIESETTLVDGLKVTTPIRTIVDLIMAPDRSDEETRRAFLAARRDGVISAERAREAIEKSPEKASELLAAWEHILKSPGADRM